MCAKTSPIFIQFKWKTKIFFNDTFNWRSVHEGQENLALVWFKKSLDRPSPVFLSWYVTKSKNRWTISLGLSIFFSIRLPIFLFFAWCPPHDYIILINHHISLYYIMHIWFVIVHPLTNLLKKWQERYFFRLFLSFYAFFHLATTTIF